MVRLGLVIAALLMITGAIFIGQGLGILRSSSAMVDDSRWAWIGAAMVTVGAGLGTIAGRRART